MNKVINMSMTIECCYQCPYCQTHASDIINEDDGHHCDYGEIFDIKNIAVISPNCPLENVE